MTPNGDGLPRVGPSARTLGVRVPADIAPDADGYVNPGTGGMSVAPESVLNLPNHRRPRAMGQGSSGPNTDHVFYIEPGPLEGKGLVTRPDPLAPSVHAFVEPTPIVRHFLG